MLALVVPVVIEIDGFTRLASLSNLSKSVRYLGGTFTATLFGVTSLNYRVFFPEKPFSLLVLLPMLFSVLSELATFSLYLEMLSFKLNFLVDVISSSPTVSFFFRHDFCYGRLFPLGVSYGAGIYYYIACSF